MLATPRSVGKEGDMCGHIPHDVIGGVHDQMCPQNQIMHQLGGDHCPPNSIFESGRHYLI